MNKLYSQKKVPHKDAEREVIRHQNFFLSEQE